MLDPRRVRKRLQAPGGNVGGKAADAVQVGTRQPCIARERGLVRVGRVSVVLHDDVGRAFGDVSQGGGALDVAAHGMGRGSQRSRGG